MHLPNSEQSVPDIPYINRICSLGWEAGTQTYDGAVQPTCIFIPRRPQDVS